MRADTMQVIPKSGTCHSVWVSCAIVTLLCVAVTPSTAASLKSEDLRSLYIVSQRVSDAAPFWFDYILEATQEQDGVLVRYIRIAPLNSACPDLTTIKATDKRLPGAKIEQLTGHANLCSISEQHADQILQAARPKAMETIFESATFGVVMHCGNSERLIKLPYPEELDMSLLKALDPQIADFYYLENRIVEQVFGKEGVFHHITLERDAELQQAGRAILPILLSGRYDRGFWHSKPTVALQRYHGPVPDGLGPTVRLLDPSEAEIVNFSAPEYPRLAELASIRGLVEIELTVDNSTGAVEKVLRVSGHPLLAKSAEATVRKWKFRVSNRALANPIKVVFDFTFNCTIPQ